VRRTGPVDDGPPQYVAFSRDGARAYVNVFSEQNSAVNRIVVVDTLHEGRRLDPGRREAVRPGGHPGRRRV